MLSILVEMIRPTHHIVLKFSASPGCSTRIRSPSVSEVLSYLSWYKIIIFILTKSPPIMGSGTVIVTFM